MAADIDPAPINMEVDVSAGPPTSSTLTTPTDGKSDGISNYFFYTDDIDNWEERGRPTKAKLMQQAECLAKRAFFAKHFHGATFGDDNGDDGGSSLSAMGSRLGTATFCSHLLGMM